MSDERMKDVEDIEEEFQEDSDEGADPEDQVGVERAITADGGLKKKIITKGTGFQKPRKGAEVTVHYTGTLEDGTKFDSSRDRDDPFVFKIGEGQVIKGWDQGVAEMKKGERAVLICRSDYGYGDNGSPPKIPGGATLHFDVELISWTEWKDITSNKNGTVQKKIVKDGDGWEEPNFDSVVTVSWKLRLDDENGKIVEEVNEREVTIGSEQVPLGFDYALEKVKKKEEALVSLTPSVAFGEKGDNNLGIPPNANVVYEYTVHDWVKCKEKWALKGAEKVEQAEIKKADGGQLFKEGKIARAIKKYELALGYVESTHDLKDDADALAKANAMANTLRLNLAACALKNSDWNEVISRCTAVLDKDPNSAKGLLRRGKAYNELNQWAESKADLKQLVEMDCPEVVEGKKELAKVQKKINAHDAKEKKLFANMFEKI